MKRYLSILALTLCVAASADPVQQNTAIGDNARQDNQLIGDTDASNNHSNSQSTQLGNSANANGATITTGIDTRDQNTVNSTTSSTGGSSHGNVSDNDNRSSVGNTSSNSGGNTLTGGAVNGANTSSNSNSTTSSGGQAVSNSSGGGGGAGGKGGSSEQRQGIEGSGNSKQSSNISTGQTVVSVDSGDRSVSTYKAIAWAPVIHGPAAAPLASSALVVVPGTCGPRVTIVRRDVVGSRFGVWGGKQDVLQGYDETIAPAEEPFAQVGGHMLGHSVTTYTAVVGTSSAASLSLGGYGKDGQGAQGGGSTGGQLQQIVQRVQVRECVVAQAKP